MNICLSREVGLSRSLKNKIETTMERAERDCSQFEASEKAQMGKGMTHTVSVWWEVAIAIQLSLWEIRLRVGDREGTIHLCSGSRSVLCHS